MNLLFPRYIEEAYKFTWRSQEKSQGSFRGRGSTRGRGKKVEESYSNQSEPMSKGGDDIIRSSSTRGRGGGKGFQVNYFKCGQLEHKSF